MSSKRISSTTTVPEMIALNASGSYWWALSLMLAVLATIVGLAYAIY